MGESVETIENDDGLCPTVMMGWDGMLRGTRLVLDRISIKNEVAWKKGVKV